MSSDEAVSDLQNLITRARNGDESALGQILEEHRAWLRIMALRQLDGPLAIRVDASDIVQQTFLLACKQINQFNGDSTGEFVAWLGRIHDRNMHDAVREHVTTQKRSIKREQSVDAQNAVVDIHASTPSHRAMRGEQAVQLARALETLPSDQEEAVRLRHLQGWSMAQLAEHFGRSDDAVAALLQRGVENLRNRMSKNN